MDISTVRQPIMPMTAPVWGQLFALAGLWGASFFFARVIAAELPPLTATASRLGVAALTLLVAIRLAGVRLPFTAADWWRFLAMGSLNNLIPYVLFFWGMIQIAGGLAAIINATVPLFTILFAHAMTDDEHLSAGKAAGVALGLAGVVVLIGADVLGSFGKAILAQLACLGGAMAYALAGVYGRRFHAQPPLVTATGHVVASTIVAVPLALMIDRPWQLPVPSAAAIAAVVAIAVLSTALAYLFYFRILRSAGATNLLLVTFLTPPTAILLGAVFLGETLAPPHFLGMVLITLGVAAIDGRYVRRLRRVRRT